MPKRRTTALKKAIVAAYAENGVITHAAEAVGIPRQTIHSWLKADAKFAAAMDEAFEASTEKLEKAAFERASRKEKPSDLLAIFMLKARRRAIYGDRVALQHGIDKDGVEEFTRLLIAMLQRVLPDMCPHCRTALALKPEVAKELQALSARLRAGEAAVAKV